MSDPIKKINLRQSEEVLTIDPVTIPNLIPSKVLKEWQEGDEDPYYKIQEIEYPIKANRYNYTESFFESFIKKLKRAPIPGSADGHEMSWGKRGKTDIILIGAKINKKGDGSGTVLFKNYFPPEGNEVLIREGKSNMLEFSLVAYTKDVREELPDGSVSYNVVESMYGERNDIVGYGEGAMEQKTNNLDIEKGDTMGKREEALLTLKNLKANAEITLLDIAKEIGLEHQVITDEQKLNIAKLNAAKALCGDIDPVDFINDLVETQKTNAAAVKDAALDKVFGLPKINEKENLARKQAETLLGDDELTEEKINAIKEDPIFKTLAAELADIDSDFNEIGISEGKNTKKKNLGVKVRKI